MKAFMEIPLLRELERLVRAGDISPEIGLVLKHLDETRVADKECRQIMNYMPPRSENPPAEMRLAATNTITTQDWLTASEGMIITNFNSSEMTNVQLVGSNSDYGEPLFGEHIRETVTTIKGWFVDLVRGV